MVINGFGRYEEPLGDFSILQTFGDEFKYLDLTGSETGRVRASFLARPARYPKYPHLPKLPSQLGRCWHRPEPVK